MAIDTLDKIISATQQKRTFWKAAATAYGAGRYHSYWKATGLPTAGATPPSYSSNGEIPTDATAGAFSFANPSSGLRTYLTRLSATTATSCRLILYDRLWHCSGLSTSDVARSFTQAALTRPDSTGAGVECFMEIYTGAANSSGSVTCTYTDSGGAASNTGTFTCPATMVTGQMVPMEFASGDSGVRSIQQMDATALGGSAVSFGLTLCRRVAEISCRNDPPVDLNAIELGMPQISDDSCLFFVAVAPGSALTSVDGSLTLSQN